MGKISKGILGGFIGRVGTVVGSRIFSIDVIRSYQPNVKNPKTESQQAQRGKFGFLVSFLRRILPVLRIGWGKAASKMSAWNAAMSHNFFNAITGTHPDYAIDYPQLKLAEGALTGFYNPLLSCIASKNVTLEWLDNIGMGDAKATDLFYGVLYNSLKDQFSISSGAIDRSDASCLFEMDEWDAGDTIHAWGFFTSEDGSKVSDSVYFGTGILVE